MTTSTRFALYAFYGLIRVTLMFFILYNNDESNGFGLVQWLKDATTVNKERNGRGTNPSLFPVTFTTSLVHKP